MPVTDREILAKVHQWLQYGDDDLLLARHGLTLKSSVPYRLIAYHAQQVRAWPESLLDAEMLTPYAITARYPGVDEPVSAEEANRAIVIAEQSRRIVRQALAEAGVELQESS
jgi:hypothetical protein